MVRPNDKRKRRKQANAVRKKAATIPCRLLLSIPST
jgi:hypothetical protein